MAPFNQFETTILKKVNILGVDMSMTNGGIFIIISILVFLWWYSMSTRKMLLMGNPWQRGLESVYGFIRDMVEEQSGKAAGKFFPAVFTVFVFILSMNLIGISPFSFAVTGQIVVTFTLSASFFVAWIIQGFINLKLDFLKVFVPKGVSKGLLPLLVAIEILSFLIRPLSLAIRLFANILAGHILLLIISNSILVLMIISFLAGVVPFLLLCAFFMLEIGIAFLQAYVFAILLCIYLKDAHNLH